ncbi:carboxypeptidase regulatory-like domain-containing protein [Pyrobaculum sp. 3827-6]|uniref:carboxypeptidase regulatory-like domain-containing protein n=1 Tax=Pyrobaculum sp. 3827-6 TaxID=2983604 RepID=UPI0021D9D3D2|nr:carboxypeptidase regulatory-like domain-containing protein [Pyrobaculum sp. 3827-6]MCU7788651.1 carboxypeptidase regulatory-like domain-containing protein [Pyrobaculum sp. 3827-6]
MTKTFLITLGLAALILAATTVVIPPTAKLEQIAYKVEETTIKIQGAGFATLAKPYVTPGEGYVYAGMKIEFLGAYPSIQIGADGQLSKTFDQNGFVSAVYVGPDASKVTLVNTAKDQVEVKVRVTYTYVKASYIPLSGDSVIEVNVPDGKLAQGFNAMARLTIEPYAPYVVKAVEKPDGTPATVYRVEPKVVEINTPGKYKISIAQGAPMPAAILVKSLSKQTATVQASGQLAVTGAEVGVPQGWRLLGYAVFAYTADANIIGKEAAGDISIEGGLVDTITDVNQNIIVRSVSYLVPPVWNFNIRYKIALVYGEQFKVSTNLPSAVNVIYIPIVYKEAQVKWLPDRALVNVTEAELADGQWTAIVMQLPELARIVAVRTPGNAMISNATDVKLVWGSGLRAASISPDGRQAYLVVQIGDTKEPGVYTFMINWSPMRIPVVDTKGRSVSYLSATADKFEASASAGYVEVKVYKPEPFTMDISYKGVKAAQVVVNSLVAKPQPVTLGIYNVKVVVVGALNQPISEASVSLEGFPASGKTDGAGAIVFKDVLAGTYKVNVDVGGRVKVSQDIEVNGDVEKVVKTPIVAVVGGVPITTLDAVATVGGLSAAGLYFALSRRKEPVAEVEQI